MTLRTNYVRQTRRRIAISGIFVIILSLLGLSASTASARAAEPTVAPVVKAQPKTAATTKAKEGVHTAGVLCDVAKICPRFKNIGKDERYYILMFDHLTADGQPYGTTKNLWPGEWSHRKMKDPDFLVPMRVGGQGGGKPCLFRSDRGKDTKYKDGKGRKIRDTEGHPFYVKSCK
jgi:hypothetical protein